MIIRIVGLLGILIGFSLISSVFKQLSGDGTDTMGLMVMAIFIGAGIFLLSYGIQWAKEGYGKKPNELLKQQELKGLKGWLILPTIGLITSLIRIFFQVIDLFQPIFKNGEWEILTTPGSEYYSPYWASFIISEIGITLFMGFAYAYLIYLFFTKKKSFPKLFIIIMLLNFVFITLDAFAIKLVMPLEEVFDPDTLKEFMRLLASCLIWIPYMLKSKRVKATFVI